MMDAADATVHISDTTHALLQRFCGVFICAERWQDVETATKLCQRVCHSQTKPFIKFVIVPNKSHAERSMERPRARHCQSSPTKSLSKDAILGINVHQLFGWHRSVQFKPEQSEDPTYIHSPHDTANGVLKTLVFQNISRVFSRHTFPVKDTLWRAVMIFLARGQQCLSKDDLNLKSAVQNMEMRNIDSDLRKRCKRKSAIIKK